MANEHNINQDILDILSWKRPGGSKSEEEMIKKFIIPTGAKPDKFGNYHLRIGKRPVMWSSHTDTVHRTPGRQPVFYFRGKSQLNKKAKSTFLCLPNDEWGDKHDFKPECLGADDGAGVWIMLELIKRGVEGLYIFHRLEERGGQGSRFISKETPEVLKEIKWAIALDRHYYSSIITRQAGQECCSKEFAEALREQLPGFVPDDTGVFTDTANYTELVPECTNLSVGYARQHTSGEWLDWSFLQTLPNRIAKLDFDKLPASRDPSVKRYNYYGSTGAFHNEYEDWGTAWHTIGHQARRRGQTKGEKLRSSNSAHPHALPKFLLTVGFTHEEILELIQLYK